MGGASSSITVHGFSWLYGSSGGEIELQEIVNGLINTQMYNSGEFQLRFIFILVGIGFKLSPAPSHQWTRRYEGVRCYIVGSHPSRSASVIGASVEKRDHPKMIISWLLRTNQIRWFYFSIFFDLVPTEPRSKKIEKVSHSQPADEGFLEKLRISNPFRNRTDSVLYIRGR
ncbi:hypothetical protein IFM89_040003 [Coptis chinensis]|uniref:NADH:quinone oxidoreductase/Mrp antiporter transmembrane domain-containing protein n=1 Tax=Coptis chinensis TaxID=261450 RepID=A0A835GUR1_9MAGN|nr:hypothetical protein IFM89_040003 [Coptis chinensis]